MNRTTLAVISKRTLLGSAGCPDARRHAAVRAADPAADRRWHEHERCMRLAIAEARGNPAYPFGAVIVRPSDTRETMARGVNNSR